MDCQDDRVYFYCQPIMCQQRDRDMGVVIHKSATYHVWPRAAVIIAIIAKMHPESVQLAMGRLRSAIRPNSNMFSQ